jgi:Ca2+-binding RTX toxin-like protein
VRFTGEADGDALFGGQANDTLNGAGGADTLTGRLGDDTYEVDNAGDTVVEALAEGTDLVRSSVSHVLAANVENLTLTGTADTNGTGNDLDNRLTGNAGGNGLNGGVGADRMTGGDGDDTYTVDNPGDVVIEASGGGIDLVRSSITFSLGGKPVENLTLTGGGNVNGTGNSLANTITGNSGDNALNGSSGADTMIGLGGNDSYVVDNAGDSVVEANGGGTDLVQSSVTFTLAQFFENLTLTGSGNVDGTGNSLANTITGNSGDNDLDGGTKSDTLTGGAGSDTFAFTSTLGATNIDSITDFNVAGDTIQLDSAIFNTILGTGVLTAAQFVANASGTAADADDRIIYETDTGNLFFDSNGSASGGRVQFAQLDTGLALTNADFFVV